MRDLARAIDSHHVVVGDDELMGLGLGLVFGSPAAAAEEEVVEEAGEEEATVAGDILGGRSVFPGRQCELVRWRCNRTDISGSLMLG